MKKITIIDVCPIDYLRDHRGLVGVYWDGTQMLRSEFRDKLADELYEEFEPRDDSDEWEAALEEFDREPDNGVFLKEEFNILASVIENEELTTIWVGLR